MKKVFIFLMLLTLVSCKNDMEIISSTKQKIIPGLKTVKPYTNYIFKIDIKSNITITIDSVLIFQNKRCLKSNYLIKNKNSAKYLDEINSKGIYFIEAAIKEGNFTRKDNCKTKKEKVVLFYSCNNQKKKIEISSFLEEEKRKR